MHSQYRMKRTKIIATVGPASRDLATMEEMARAGVNGIRLNMSHGTHEEHAEVIKRTRQISAKLGKPLAVIADLQGPKIRLGLLPSDGLVLKAGSTIQLAYGDEYDQGKPIPVQHDISKYVKKGHPLFLRDGMVQAEVTKVAKNVIYAKVLNPGVVFSKQGINLPETSLGGDILTEKDLDDIKFVSQQDVDYVALSFVQSADDIEGLRKRLWRLRSEAAIIAKIETKAATTCLTDIVRVADVIMVARGDLAVEVGSERVPILQQQIIELAKQHQKTAIVATQMLESMIESPQPTRAEVNDVATAVGQGADAVMLSGESAIGKYPVETVVLMKRVILYTEQNRFAEIGRGDDRAEDKRSAISVAAITLAKKMRARLILAETSSGQTVRNLVSFRPPILVLGVTSSRRVYQQLAIMWGSRAYLIRKPETAHQEVMKMLHQEHNVAHGDILVRVTGTRTGVTGSTNTIQVEVVA